MRPNYVYVASSWRNPMHVAVCTALESVNIEHYNFQQPDGPGSSGFHWSEVMPYYEAGSQCCHEDEYLESLSHPIAQSGFDKDMSALDKADTVILILPCGRSAHLELGYAVGQNKKTAILLDGPIITPDLMYKMVDSIQTSLFDLLGWLGVED